MSDTQSYTFVSAGKVPVSISIAVRDAVAAARGKKLKLTLAAAKKYRTDNQNRFFHGPFIEDVTQVFRNAGNNVNESQVKQYMKELFGLREKITMPDGKQNEVLKSTADYTTIEIEEFMTKIRVWGAEYGFSFCFPNELENA